MLGKSRGWVFFGFVAVCVLLFLAPKGIDKTKLHSLEGEWDFCRSEHTCEERLSIAVPTDTLASDLIPAGQIAIYETEFDLPHFCIEGCSFVAGEIGDAAEFFLNGQYLGSHGSLPPSFRPAKSYPVDIALPSSFLQPKNTLRIKVYSPRAFQRGIRIGPVGIAERSAARSFSLLSLFNSVFIPLAGSVSLFIVTFLSLTGPRLRGLFALRLRSGVILFAMSSAVYLLTFSGVARELVSSDLATPFHFALRAVFDLASYVLMVSLLHKTRPQSFPWIVGAYITYISLYALVPAFDSVFPPDEPVTLFDRSVQLMRMGLIFPLFPFSYGVYASFSQKAPAVLRVFALALFSMNIFDCFIFLGFVQSQFLGKFYPVFAALVGFNYLQSLARAEDRERTAELEKHTAVGVATAAISHDVRKPLSMCKVVLNAIQSLTEPEALRSFAKEAMPDIHRSIDQAEGLLQDVMQVGASRVELTKEEVAPEQLVSDVLADIFRGQPHANVNISFTAKSQTALLVDVHKVKRIFSNIIVNACQAIHWKGFIWIGVVRENDRVQFTVGNSGSLIPKESIASLFEAFFTSNKRGGTGLGLAIAKKWTEAHEGRISCRSEKNKQHPNGFVEFMFDLPAVESASLKRPEVPDHSSQYRMELAIEGQKSENRELDALVEEVKVRLSESDPLTVVALDDETPYLRGLKMTLDELQLGESVSIELFDSEPKLGLPESLLYLVDFDLGQTDRNGIDVISDLKKRRSSAFICLHTNRTDAETFRSALDAGADTVHTKPLTAVHFAKLLLEATRRR